MKLFQSLLPAGTPVHWAAHDPGARTVTQTFLSGNLQRTITHNRLDNLRTSDTVPKNGTPVPDLALSCTCCRRSAPAMSVSGLLPRRPRQGRRLESRGRSVKKQVSTEKPRRLGGVLDSPEGCPAGASAREAGASQTTTAGDLLAHAGFTASHDPASRLTGIVRSDGVPPSFTQKTWSYDKNGNWSRVETDGRGVERAHDNANQVTKVGASGLTHNARGEMAKDHDGSTYIWDPAGRLRWARVDGQTTKYKYDALGRRVWRKRNTPPTVLVWWGDHEQAELQHQSGEQTIANYVHSHPERLNALIARAVGGDERKIQHYHKNYLDHVYAVSDKDGNVLERYRYSPFGQIEIYGPTGTYLGNSTKNSAIGNTRTWNTRILDPDTNLYMYKYRHYHAALGRFMSRDPIGEDGGVNLYAFVGNEPINSWDRLGLAPKAVNFKTKCNGKITGTFDSYKVVVAGTVEGGGVIIDLDYTQGDTTSKNCCCKSWRWQQTVWTNHPLGGTTSPYNDPRPNDDNKPWYWTDAEYQAKKKANGTSFYDKPGRPVNPTKRIYWRAELVLKCLDKNGKVIKDLVFIYYGFHLHKNGTITTNGPSATNGK